MSVKVQALVGAQNDAPYCYLLDIDGYRILLDCGWQDDFNTAMLEPLKRVVGSVNVVLLSHPDLSHLGALPYAVAKLGLDCPVYGTLPVFNMGQLFLYDTHQSRANREDFHVFSLDDVDEAFSERRWRQLKYHQSVTLPIDPVKPQKITVTPLPAGHMVGGTVWRIVKDQDEIVYAVSYNHAKENHLEGSSLQTDFLKPSLFITDSSCVYTTPNFTRKQRDQNIFDHIVKTCNRGGDILIPVDSAGRILELAYLLEQKWDTNEQEVRRKGYGVCMLTYHPSEVLKYAQTMTEWMSDTVQKSSIEGKSQFSFKFRHVQGLSNMNALSGIPQPRVILASSESLNSSFALDLFMEMASDEKNTVLLTGRSHPNSLTRRLLERKKDAARTMTIEHKKRVPLEGQELAEFERKALKRRHSQMSGIIGTGAGTGTGLLSRRDSLAGVDALVDDVGQEEDQEEDQDQDDEDDNDANDEEDVGAAGGAASATGSTATVPAGGDDAMEIDSGSAATTAAAAQATPAKASAAAATAAVGFFKHARTFPMYTYNESRARFDDYGEIVDPQDFVVKHDEAAATGTAAAAAMDVDAVRKPPGSVEQGVTQQQQQKKKKTPTKAITQSVDVELRCTIAYVDAQGLADLSSVKTILEAVQPKKLVVINGDEQTSKMFRAMCQSSKHQEIRELMMPQLNVSIDASFTTDIVRVVLTDSLVSSLRTATSGENEISYVSAVVGSKNKDDSMMVLDVASSSAAEQRNHAAVFIGEVRLNQFRKVLNNEGLFVEMKETVLICNNELTIRKTETGRLTLEGPLSATYYRVRSLLYNQYAIV